MTRPHPLTEGRLVMALTHLVETSAPPAEGVTGYSLESLRRMQDRIRSYFDQQLSEREAATAVPAQEEKP